MLVSWKWSNSSFQWKEGKENNESDYQSFVSLNGTEYQRMLGFGACFNEKGYECFSELDAETQNNVMKELFSKETEEGCRFEICRLPVGANDYSLDWYSLDEHPDDYNLEHFSIDRDKNALIPFIKEALKYKNDLVLMASPWSPPMWMKIPQRYNGGVLNKDPRIQNVYAHYLVKFLEEYRKEGIKIDQLHVQNEPVADQKFPSCLWTGEELKVFIRDYLGPILKKSDAADTELWLGTINAPGCDFKRMIFDKWSYEDYDYFANTVLSDDEAAKYITGVSYQWGGKIAIQRTFESWWPKYRLMQTENECGFGDNTWDNALYNWTMLKHYISNGAESYLYWNLILPPMGISTWSDPQNSMVTVDKGKIIYNPDFYVMKHFSSIVRKGAIRLGLKGSFAGDTLVFRNPDGSYAVEMMNPFMETRKVKLELGNDNCIFELRPRSINSMIIQ